MRSFILVPVALLGLAVPAAAQECLGANHTESDHSAGICGGPPGSCSVKSADGRAAAAGKCATEANLSGVGYRCECDAAVPANPPPEKPRGGEAEAGIVFVGMAAAGWWARRRRRVR